MSAPLDANLDGLRDGNCAVPAELRPLKQWVIWRAEWDESKKKYKKPPHSPDKDQRIGATKKYRSHFVSFDEALAASEKFGADGIGLVFTEQDQLVGIDFDDCVSDGVIDPEVENWLKWFPSYAEISVSGTGIHIICYGKLAKAVPATKLRNSSATVELYCTGRFFTVTGKALDDHRELTECPDGIDKLLATLGQEKGAPKTAPADEHPMAKRTAKRIYADMLDIFRAMTRPGDSQNEQLNTCAFFAARAFAAKVFDSRSEEDIKREIIDIARSTPYCPGIEATFRSGWSKGIAEPLALKEESELDRFFARYTEEKGFSIIRNYGGKTRVVWRDAYDHPAFAGCWELAAQSYEEFKKAYINDKVFIQRDDRMEILYAAKEWIEDGATPRFEKVVFQPEQKIENCMNLWNGWAVAPNEGDCQLYLNHIREVICGGNEKYYEYVIKWMAYAVQHPNEQGHAALVLRGPKGIGKNMFADGFGKPWGPHYITLTNAEHFVGRFNAPMRHCSVLCANEAFYAGNKQHEQALKALVTDPTIAIEQKFVDVKMCPNLTHVIVLSNSDWVVPATPGERRYFVLDVSDKYKGNQAYFEKLASHVTRPNAALLYHLLHLDLGNYNPRYVPNTPALFSQVAHGLEGVEAAWFECLNRGELPAIKEKGKILMTSTAFIKWADEQRGRKWVGKIRAEHLGHLLGENPRAKGKGMGFQKNRDSDGRGWVIPSLKQCWERWNEKCFPAMTLEGFDDEWIVVEASRF